MFFFWSSPPFRELAVAVLDTPSFRIVTSTPRKYCFFFRQIVGVPTAGVGNGGLSVDSGRLFAGIIAIINDSRDRVAIEFRVCEESAGIAETMMVKILLCRSPGFEAANTDDYLFLNSVMEFCCYPER